MWLSLRAFGKGRALLHTAPLYIYIDGESDFSDHKTAGQLAQKYRDILSKFRHSTPKLDVEFERFAVEKLIQSRWQASRQLLDKAIDETIAIYDHLITR